MSETDRFLTTEEGYQFAAIIEMEVHLDTDFLESRDIKRIEASTWAAVVSMLR